MAAKPDETNRFKNIRKDSTVMDNYDGDTMTVRYGGTCTLGFARAFGYYLRYGATEHGGTDITDSGLATENKSDGDYFYFYGGRLFQDFRRLGYIDFTYAESTGVDYRFENTYRFEGKAWSLNYSLDIIRLFGLSKWAFKYITPSVTLGDFSEGFCGMKASSFGDHLLDDYLGYSVSPYTDAYHFHDFDNERENATYADKTVSKKFNKYALSVMLGFDLSFDFSYMELYANDRNEGQLLMGKLYTGAIGYTGNSINMKIGYSIYHPDEYYKVKSVDNPYINEGKDPFYVYSFIFTSKFTLIH
ncbi:MAG: hypothetical protein JXK07_12115 [Spirochaetes bacterium]|nr:hypothetical protein [Spirochaetota bacterium]MBN2770413.1 hypothetical protein [Spirochaetota bacterium]